MTTNTTNNEMLTSDGDLVAPASQVACLECPDSDAGIMTRVSNALRQYAEENDLEVIDVPLATVDDADSVGMPKYDSETGVVKYNC